MPVATADDFITKPEKPQVPNRQRKKSTSARNVISERESTLHVASNYHHHSLGDNQPSASYLPRHSPILNLSPNLSPESHASSSSPVLELLDSNQRRTVQDLYGSWTHLTQDLVNMVNEEESKDDVPPVKKRKMVEGTAGAACHPTSRPRSLRQRRPRESRMSAQPRYHIPNNLNPQHAILEQRINAPEAIRYPITDPEPLQQAYSRQVPTLPHSYPPHIVHHPGQLPIDLSNSSTGQAPVLPTHVPEQTRAAMVSAPLLVAGNMHSAPQRIHPDHIARDHRRTLTGQTFPPAPFVTSQQTQHHQISNSQLPNIPAAHQTRLYAGHQPCYAQQSRMELGASARRIHQLQQQYPALINHLPTPSMLAPEMAGAVATSNVIHRQLPAGVPAMHPFARQIDQRIVDRHSLRPPPTTGNHPHLNNPSNCPNFLFQLWSVIGNHGSGSSYRFDLPEEMPDVENYEALLNLAERLGEAKPKGLSKSDIDHLVSYRYNSCIKKDSTRDQTSCVVCMSDFEGRQMLRVLPCAHEFHSKCVDKWLRSNRTCPICRSDASKSFA